MPPSLARGRAGRQVPPSRVQLGGMSPLLSEVKSVSQNPSETEDGLAHCSLMPANGVDDRVIQNVLTRIRGALNRAICERFSASAS